METKYWKPTVAEAKEFVTYSFDSFYKVDEDKVDSFYKKPVSVDVMFPAESKEGEMEKAEAWWKATNKEDLYVLEREKEAFMAFYNSEKEEILKHIKV
jgi:hypothetical protein